MGLKPLLLDTQYRMHPSLAEFPSAKFYGGLLCSWPKPADRPLPEGLHWPNVKVRPYVYYFIYIYYYILSINYLNLFILW
jgi:superfamily I DNA and/or RNA helicase